MKEGAQPSGFVAPALPWPCFGAPMPARFMQEVLMVAGGMESVTEEPPVHLHRQVSLQPCGVKRKRLVLG